MMHLQVTVYGDVLAAINFIVTLAILRLCGKILGVSPGRVSRYIASVLGAAAAFIIFVPIHSTWLELLYRLFVSVLVVGVAFPTREKRTFLKATGIFYAVSFLVAGVVAGLLWLFPSAGFYTQNGVVYFNLHPLTLLGAVAVAYGVVSLFDRFNSRRTARCEIFELTVKRGGHVIKLRALSDSGNRLIEPFSGLPVVVASTTSVWPLLSDAEKRVISAYDQEEPLPGLRWILCQSISEQRLLPAIRPEAITVNYDGRAVPVGAYLALSREPIGAGKEYSAVMNPKMIQVLL